MMVRGSEPTARYAKRLKIAAVVSALLTLSVCRTVAWPMFQNGPDALTPAGELLSLAHLQRVPGGMDQPNVAVFQGYLSCMSRIHPGSNDQDNANLLVDQFSYAVNFTDLAKISCP